jgi:SAM-dependent methyltransferase
MASALRYLPRPAGSLARRVYPSLEPSLLQPYFRLRALARMRRNNGKARRLLEIGPGARPLQGFESLDVVGRRHVDYVCDIEQGLPFGAGTFDLVYSSHVLEHVPWFASARVVNDWFRVLKPGGRLEVWVPDGEMIARVLLTAARTGSFIEDDGWRVRNEPGSPDLWANGRLFYGANPGYPSWHKAVFTEGWLTELFAGAGFVAVRRAGADEYRGGANHGPINLGIFGDKPGGPRT